jgi:ligand-binding sensor domain-containing protein
MTSPLIRKTRWESWLRKSFVCVAIACLLVWLPPARALAQNEITWQPTNGPYGGIVNAFAVNASGTIFAATRASGVFRSDNQGDTWARTGLPGGDIFSLAVNSRGHLFAGLSNGVLRSTDDGQTWKNVNAGMTDVKVWVLVFNSSGHLFGKTAGSSVRLTMETRGR